MSIDKIAANILGKYIDTVKGIPANAARSRVDYHRGVVNEHLDNIIYDEDTISALNNRIDKTNSPAKIDGLAEYLEDIARKQSEDRRALNPNADMSDLDEMISGVRKANMDATRIEDLNTRISQTHKPNLRRAEAKLDEADKSYADKRMQRLLAIGAPIAGTGVAMNLPEQEEKTAAFPGIKTMAQKMWQNASTFAGNVSGHTYRGSQEVLKGMKMSGATDDILDAQKAVVKGNKGAMFKDMAATGAGVGGMMAAGGLADAREKQNQKQQEMMK